MKISQIVKERIAEYQVTEPILVDELVRGMEEHRTAVTVTLHRLAVEGVITHYKKGVYYKPKTTRFGQIGVDKIKLIEKKYLIRNLVDMGYITGPQIWNDWGLTTQIPKRIWIAQNIRQKRLDDDLNILHIPAKGEIKKTNIKALQFLDIIDQIEHIPDTAKEDVARKLIVIYKEKLDTHEKVAAMSEVRKYPKKVKVLFGLIAESAEINNEYFVALLQYQKEDVQKGKKIIVDMNPEVFNHNRTWGNGYALAQKY